MTSRHPTKVEQFAIEAKLNLILGAEVYDRVFQGFEVLEVANGELRGWSPSEHRAAVIDVLGHSGLGCPDRAEPAGPTVNVLVRGNELRGERATCVSNFGSQHRYRELGACRRVPVTVGR